MKFRRRCINSPIIAWDPYWYRIFTKGQKTKPNQIKPRAELERALKTEAKGTKGLKTELKRTFSDRLDNVCAFKEVKRKSKSTPGYGIRKSIKRNEPTCLEASPCSTSKDKESEVDEDFT
ncbi:hypothetical protein Tco_1107155 [Tanacetum coccineum]